ncbi:hypothetical protein AB0M20_44980, partial [Actinoplanes sp. NPDC051633]|uniref:hypothetical protein n=1 Tax=Actinoplanes sp. NPDC051633 TaxID=3155670 RepID=UPI00343B0D5B
MYLLCRTPTFKDCTDRYSNRPEIQAAMFKVIDELFEKPFHNPKLKTHAVKKAQPDTFTSYVTNDGHRVIWRHVGRRIVLLLFGEHDAVYRRAERLRLEIDDDLDVLRVMDEDPNTGKSVPYQTRRAAEGKLFMAWNTNELAEMGFASQEIGVLRGLNDESELTDLQKTMRPEAWDRAM